jgi:hypothetical protein
MMMKSGFMQWQNGDSTTDVICLDCFETIANSGEQPDLAAAERDHVCSLFHGLVMFLSGSLADLSKQARTAPMARRAG